jgi:thiamine biosynthesis lipoprotein
MLRRYEVLFAATGGKINPCIGFALEDAGYDRTYSLVPKTAIRPVPRMNDAILIVNDTHLTLREPVLIDLGALGKGYLVDMLYDFLRARGVGRFLVDGSGDVRYFDVAATKITCALEDPRDATKAIGTLAMTEGALCASATNRRRWGAYHHYLDPVRVASPETIVATWVYASTATLADSLSSALFFVPPEALSAFSFEYLVVNHEFRIKKSAGFNALMFS